MFVCLLYLTTSRPDIWLIVRICARFQYFAKVSHLNAMKRVSKYLEGPIDIGLWYPKSITFDILGNSDADSAGCLTEEKSISGTCQFLVII